MIRDACPKCHRPVPLITACTLCPHCILCHDQKTYACPKEAKT